jgi:hypothetical protein
MKFFGVFAGIVEGRLHGGWHDFDSWREHHRDLLREAEARRLAREGRPGCKERFGEYLGLFGRFLDGLLGAGRRVVPSRNAFPPDEEVATSRPGLVEAIVEDRARPVRSSSVIELHREADGFVIREVDLGTGENTLYLSTEEPEWAAWIWEQKIHRSPEAQT